MKSLIKRSVKWLAERVAITPSEGLILSLVRWKLLRLSPDEALRFLFRLDDRLYKIQGGKAVEYGNGVHTKHRHMSYHDFFSKRVRSGERVLDIGCGIGALAFDVAEHSNASITGIDMSAENIAVAQERFKHRRIQYVVGDALKDLPNESFDVVMLSNVLEHLPERAAFLRRVQTTNSPTRILIRVPLFERDWRVPLKQELGVEWRLDKTHETEYTLEDYKDEIEQAGLELVELQVRWGEIWSEVRAIEASNVGFDDGGQQPKQVLP